MGVLNGLGKVYLQAVVDTYGSYAFVFLHKGKKPEAAVAVLHNDALPFYREKGHPVEGVRYATDNGREFCGTDIHHYEMYLELNDIQHRKTQVRRPQSNGFVERFNRTVLDEFFRVAFRKKFYESVESLQIDLDEWLVHYNKERPHQGYRKMSCRPADTVNEYAINNVRQDPKEYAQFVLEYFFVRLHCDMLDLLHLFIKLSVIQMSPFKMISQLLYYPH